MRFQIDPRTARSPPAAPAAPPPSAAAPAAPPPPPGVGLFKPAAPPAAAPAGTANRKRLYVAAGLAALLLAGSALGALYAMEMAPFDYPRRYMLEGDEIPAGMRLGTIPREMQNEFGVSENPGKMDQDALQEMGEGMLPPPEEAWVEALAPQTGSGSVMIFAFRFANADDASDWTSMFRMGCSGEQMGVLVKDDVVVVVGPEGRGGEVLVPRVIDALVREAPGLDVVCSGRAR